MRRTEIANSDKYREMLKGRTIQTKSCDQVAFGKIDVFPPTSFHLVSLVISD